MSEENPPTFPANLLNKSNTERLEHFRAFTVKHPLLSKAYEELRCAIRDSNVGSIIFVYGPTGVGKTTLLKRIEEHITQVLLADLTEDLERLPVVRIRLSAPTLASFDWKDYFKRLLIKLEEPLVDRKIDMTRWRRPDMSNSSNMNLINNQIASSNRLRFAAEQAMHYRRLVAILIDDAQHLGVVASGRRLIDQLNTIKSIADMSHTTHVMCGTYELIPLRNLNGQLSRRSVDIQFERYHAEDEKQRREFINVLYTFQHQLPLVNAPDLVSRWDYFYERSIGCVGVLKDWLTGSLALALEEGRSTLTTKCLERRARTVAQCTTMLSEAAIGEEELTERDEEHAQLRRNLGLAEESCKEAERNITPEDLEVRRSHPKHRKHRVGTRNPVRDKIGVKSA